MQILKWDLHADYVLIQSFQKYSWLKWIAGAENDPARKIQYFAGATVYIQLHKMNSTDQEPNAADERTPSPPTGARGPRRFGHDVCPANGMTSLGGPLKLLVGLRQPQTSHWAKPSAKYGSIEIIVCNLPKGKVVLILWSKYNLFIFGPLKS